MPLSFGPVAGDAMSAIQPPRLSARSYPYLMQQGVKLTIARVRVRITGSTTGTGPKIRGFVANVLIVPEAPLAHLVGGDDYVGIDIELTAAFTANKVDFHDRYQIDWEVSRDGSTWEYAGTSANQIYVCLADPNMNGATMFRTLVHLACSNAGATSETEAKTKTWELFSKDGGPTDVKTWDGRQLYYYQPGTVFENQPPGFPGNAFCSVAKLLTMRTGQCSVWANLLQDAWSVNGVISDYVLAVAADEGGFFLFLVSTWTDLSTNPARPFWYQTPVFPPSMVPGPPGAGGDASPFGYYDDPNDPQFFLNQKSLKGQGTGGDPDECPSQKSFDNHQILRYAGTYDDPSYGVTYANPGNFQSALAGYLTDPVITGSNRTMVFHLFPTSGLPKIFFTVRPVGAVLSGTSATVFTLETGEGAKFVMNQNIEIHLASNKNKPEVRVISNVNGDEITVSAPLSATPVSGDTMTLACQKV